MKSMPNSYTSKEKLKKKKEIELLFEKGKSVTCFPLKLMYVEADLEDSWVRFGVSASKRNFKRAVDRNFLKRRMREAFRKNKPALQNLFKQPHLAMLIFIGTEKLSATEIETKYLELLEKLGERE